jgi:glycosyltransferase involved in cell wall biosynthesis
MAARFATEKGVEVLSSAMKRVIEVYPDAQVWFAGPYENILGEQGYFNLLVSDIRKLEASGNWHFLGLLSPREMSAFYRNIDMLVIPSLNSTEAFGLVQIEAMFHDVPSIASDLPGVRQPVLRHQLGEVIPIGDAPALADSVIKVVENKKKYPYSAQQLKSQYSPERAAERYEALFEEIGKEIIKKGASKREPQR